MQKKKMTLKKFRLIKGITFVLSIVILIIMAGTIIWAVINDAQVLRIVYQRPDNVLIDYLEQKNYIETFFNILFVLWSCSVTIFIFVIGKTDTIYYGIKFGNILLWFMPWPVGVVYIVFYILFLPIGFWCYICGWGCLLAAISFCSYAYMLFVFFFIMCAGRKTVLNRIIQIKTMTGLEKILSKTPAEFNREVNLLPVMNMIRSIDYDNAEEMMQLKELLLLMTEGIYRNNPGKNYMILVPVFSAILDCTGTENRYQVNRIIEFFEELLEDAGEKLRSVVEEDKNRKKLKKMQLDFLISIFIPVLEHAGDCDRSKDYTTLYYKIEGALRIRLLPFLLLYMEYLYNCGDKGTERIRLFLESRMIEDMKNFQYSKNLDEELTRHWFVWNMVDNQKDFTWDVFEQFVEDGKNWQTKYFLGFSYIWGSLKVYNLMKK